MVNNLKRLKKYGIVLVLCALLLTGCSKNASEATSDYSNHVVPNIVELGKNIGGKGGGYYYYSIDRNTGVVYLIYSTLNGNAITVMLNVDGTPVTAEQLGINCPYNR